MIAPEVRLLQAVATLLRRIGLRDWQQKIASLRRYLQRRVVPSWYPRYGPAELHSALAQVGVEPGATIFVHTAWDEFYNFDGTPVDLVEVLRQQVGSTGTVAMPAYPLSIDVNAVFDARRTPTGAGLVPELFRRMRGAQRSINLYQSVAALGSKADYLVRDHHKSRTPWDECSPYARLAELDATILCLGLPPSFGLGTSLHCPESLLYDEIPYFRTVFGPPVRYRYRDAKGVEGEHALMRRIGRWSPNRVRRHIDSNQVRVVHLSNLRIQAIGARYLTDRMIELARRGVVNYYWPVPWRWLFNTA